MLAIYENLQTHAPDWNLYDWETMHPTIRKYRSIEGECSRKEEHAQDASYGPNLALYQYLLATYA